MARPTKLTKAVQKRICDAIRQGATYELAAKYAGVTYTTFNNWCNAGRDAEAGEFFEFFEAIQEAEGTAAVKWLKKIEAAANKGNWTAAAWKLERRYPADYGRQVTELRGKVEGDLAVSAADFIEAMNRAKRATEESLGS